MINSGKMYKDQLLKVLIIDDEEDICEILQFNLDSEGYKTEVAYSAEDALKLNLSLYDVFIVDVMMKGMSGYRLADEIRNKRKLVAPIIFLTARNTENDKLTGFSVGADDYITKPFSIKEVIARVKAVTRRAVENKNPENQNIIISGIELDMAQKRLVVDGKKEDLTPTEFELLNIMMKHPGRIFDRSQFLDRIWNEVNVTDRTVDVHITRLRRKLGKYGNLLVTRKGYGYYFDKDNTI